MPLRNAFLDFSPARLVYLAAAGLLAACMSFGGACSKRPASDKRPFRPSSSVPSHAPVLSGSRSVKGTVVDNLGAVDRATVRVRGVSIDARTVTDSYGRFEISHLPSERVWVQATKRGHIPSLWGQARSLRPARQLDLADDNTSQHLSLRLEQGGSVHGRVLDERGNPVSGAVVTASRRNGSSFDRPSARLSTLPMEALVLASDGSPHTNTTNSTGEFVVGPLPAASYDVSVIAPTNTSTSGSTTAYVRTYYPGRVEYSGSEPIRVIDGAQAEITMTIRKASLSALSGRVVNRTGTGVAGAIVRVLHGRSAGPVEYAEAAAVVRSSPTGEFSAKRLPPGDYVVVASTLPPVTSNPGVPSAMGTQTVLVPDGRTLEGVIVAIRGAATVGGVLRWVSPQPAVPVEHLRVFAVPYDHQELLVPTSFTVSPGGKFEVPTVFSRSVLSVGLEKLGTLMQVTADSMDLTASGVTPDSSRPAATVKLTLSSSRSIVGLVTAAGKPVSADLLVASTDHRLWHDPLGRFARLSTTDEAGGFEIHGLPDGKYWVLARRSIDIDILNDESAMSLALSQSAPILLNVTQQSESRVVVTCENLCAGDK